MIKNKVWREAMGRDIKVVLCGVGPIGQYVAREVFNRNGIRLIGVCDINQRKIGKDIGEICGIGPIDLKVTKELDSILPKCDLVIITTFSSIEKIYPQIEEAVRLKKFVVTTCEELSFPLYTNSNLSKKIDQLALDNNVGVLSTGVNPGFLMDSLPIFLTTMCLDVKKIIVGRFQNASLRRIPFQRKIGVGNTLEQFRERVREGSIKHVGFPESIYMIASKLNWKIDKIKEDVSPIVTERMIENDTFIVEPGKVSGIKQVAKGSIDGEERIVLEMQASLEYENPRDEIWIKGKPDIHSIIEGGINGDIATVAAVINSIPQVLKAKPGLRNMNDIALTSFYKGFDHKIL